jgi:hypothetical protein
MRRVAVLLVGLISLVGRAVAAIPDGQAFTYAGPGGVQFTVTADGLSSIRVGERVVARGGWYAWNAGPSWFGRGTKDVLVYPGYSAEVYRAVAQGVADKRLEILSPTQARVRHVQPQVVTTYDYTFAGEDVTIQARVENNHPTAELTTPAFGGLRFTFTREPTGDLKAWHISYLQAAFGNVFHPSSLNKIGGSYAADETVGVGLTPMRTGLAPTLFLWDYDAWNPTTVERKANRWLTYVRPAPIPAGGALTFSMQLRVSRTTTWQHLLGPYKAHFLATFGPKRYATDFRAVGVAHVNRNPEAIGPGNPYGFHGGPRRLDTKDGVEAFCAMTLPGLAKANGQGLIIWGQTGQEPRGQMYRSDFDVLPPEVEAHWPLLQQRFAEQKQRLGVCTRPSQLQIRLNWTQDGTLEINPDDPQHLQVMVWNRFKRMIEKGCTLFYLDSFGGSLADVKTMRALREKMGPAIATFAEHQCDALAVYSAFYSETDFWAKGSAEWVTADGFYPRAGTSFLQVVNWLLGPVPVITRVYDIHGKIPAGFENSTRFFYRHGMTPMLQDYTIEQQAPGIRALQEEYLAAGGQWKAGQ